MKDTFIISLLSNDLQNQIILIESIYLLCHLLSGMLRNALKPYKKQCGTHIPLYMYDKFEYFIWWIEQVLNI